jgi:uncharacterized SAM-binding protein YcdF (DUF218 family)
LRLQDVSRARWLFLLLVSLAGVIYLAREPILTRIGRGLVRADTLLKADAIVVLAGETPVREIEASELFRAGYAPRVLLTAEADPAGAHVLRERGIPFEFGVQLRKRLIVALGVPDSAVTLLNARRVSSTRDEAAVVREWAAAHGSRRIIVVTSRYHSGRASLIFTDALRHLGVEVITRPATVDPFQPEHWWRDWSQLRNGILEWQKLIFYSLSSRLAPAV